MFCSADRSFLPVACRAHLVAFVVALLVWPGGPARAQRADPLIGLWGFDHVAGPAISGPLILSRAGDRWHLRVAGYEISSVGAADTVLLELPGGKGTLRVHVRQPKGVRAATAGALWIQPAGINVSYATPVHLTPASAGAWTGELRPIEERFTLYLDIRRDSTDSLVARFRNPQGNFGGARRFRVARESTQVVLSDAATQRRRFTQPFDSAAHTIGFDFGVPLSATPTPRSDAIGFAARTGFDRPYSYRVPVALGDGWSAATPRSLGLDADTLTAMVRRAIDTDPLDDLAPRIHSVVIARHGRIVLDEYFHGYAADRPHDLRSASKTMTSVMLGVAMFRGARLAVETKVTPAGATIGQLLTHTSGLACNDDDPDSPGNEDVMQDQRGERDWYRYAMALPQRVPPGTAYAYCSAGINLVGQAIGNSTHRWLPEFFDSEVAQPLGFERYGMNLMPSGEGYAAGGMHLRPRDLLKIGQLYLDHGVWHGRRLLARRWVDESTRRQQPVADGADDGFAWHRHTLQAAGRTVASYEASGNGGQFLVVIPSLDMAVVVTAGNYGQGRLWQTIRQEFIARYVLAAVRH